MDFIPNTEKERKEMLQELLEKQKAGTLTAAERYKIPLQEMPEQDPQVRRTGFGGFRPL